MRDAASAEKRSVTVFLDDEAFSWLVAEARTYRRSTAGRASELLTMALAAQRGPTGDKRLDTLVQRLNKMAQAVTAPSPPPAAPIVQAEEGTLPALPLVRQAPVVPDPKPQLQSELQYAALSTRGRALRDLFSLSCVEAGILDVLLNDGQFLPQQIQEMLPAAIRPSTLNSLQVSVSTVRTKTQLGFDHLLHVRGGGYRVSAEGRTIILARIGATV